MLKFLILSLFFSLSSEAVILKRLSSCGSESGFGSNTMTQSYQKLLEFPKGLFLAREVVHTVQSNGDLIYKTHKKMLEVTSSETETCFFGKPLLNFKSQAFLPVMIDLTELQNVGHAYWKFSLDIENQVGSVVSQRSLVQANVFQDRLLQQGFDIEKVQLSHDEFELRLKRSNQQSTESYIVLYDRKSKGP